MNNQIDRLANDIGGFLNDFENGDSDKEETIKNLCFYIGERVKTAVQSDKVKGVKDFKKEFEELLNEYTYMCAFAKSLGVPEKVSETKEKFWNWINANFVEREKICKKITSGEMK